MTLYMFVHLLTNQIRTKIGLPQTPSERRSRLDAATSRRTPLAVITNTVPSTPATPYPNDVIGKLM